VNAATGAFTVEGFEAATVTAFVIVFSPNPITCNVTLYFPAAANECTGLWSVEVEPSPKSQLYANIVPVLLSVNYIPYGAAQVVCVVVNVAVGSAKSYPPVPSVGIVTSDPSVGIVIPNPSIGDVAAIAIDDAEIKIATTKAIGNSIPLFFI
jgi:hypothetical protein